MNLQEKSERFVLAVRQVLLSDWDPIGVGEWEDMQDEYDSYIDGLLDLFEKDDVSKQNIIDYLNEIETVYMELTPNAKRTDLAAENIWQHFQTFLNT